MKDNQCVSFLQWATPRMGLRWAGFRKVRRQVCRRIDRRLKTLKLPDVDAYRRRLEADPDEWPVLESLCRVTISRLYRDRGVFDTLGEVVLPELAEGLRRRGENRLRTWSVGCASGEEPYTLAILWRLRLAGRFPDVEFSVLATDIDETTLDRARRGCYPPSSVKDVPRQWLPLAFDEIDRQSPGDSGEDHYCVKPPFRRSVEFRRQDIRRQSPEEKFSLILCRHLAFTYFDEPTQRKTLEVLIRHLEPGGALMAGKQEPLPEGETRLEEWRPHSGVYRVR